MMKSRVLFTTLCIIAALVITIYHQHIHSKIEGLKWTGSRITFSLDQANRNISFEVLKEFNVSEPVMKKRTNLLTIFTTFKNTPERLKIQSNTAKNWMQFSPKIQPILFNTFDNKSFSKLVSDIGWAVLNATRTNSFKTPYLKDMYFKAYDLNNGSSFFYGFSNGDILFDDGLIPTLECVKNKFPNTSSLIVGRRSNHNINLSQPLYKPDIIRSIKAPLFRLDAEDYFFISLVDKFPWDYFKDVVIGRPGYDNYLVGQSVIKNITVIDATKTLKALHQTGTEGNFAGSKNKDAHYNHRLLGNFPYGKGITSRTQFFTMFSKEKEVITVKRL